MASKYPNELDEFPEDWSTADPERLLGPDVDDHASAINAVQATLGTSPFDWSGLVEDWHVVGEAGEPAFATGKENEDGTGADVPAWTSATDPAPGGLEFPYPQNCPVAFYKDPLGVVHLKGAAMLLSAFTDSGQRQGLIFTLPDGYRPGQVLSFGIPRLYDGFGVELPGIAVSILTDGKVGNHGSVLADESVNIEYTGTALSLDGISFRAA